MSSSPKNAAANPAGGAVAVPLPTPYTGAMANGRPVAAAPWWQDVVRFWIPVLGIGGAVLGVGAAVLFQMVGMQRQMGEVAVRNGRADRSPADRDGGAERSPANRDGGAERSPPGRVDGGDGDPPGRVDGGDGDPADGPRRADHPSGSPHGSAAGEPRAGLGGRTGRGFRRPARRTIENAAAAARPPRGAARVAPAGQGRRGSVAERARRAALIAP